MLYRQKDESLYPTNTNPDGRHGIQLIDELYKYNTEDQSLLYIIVVSSFFERDTVVNVIRSGARVFINKPMPLKRLSSVIYQMTFVRFCREFMMLIKNKKALISIS